MKTVTRLLSLALCLALLGVFTVGAFALTNGDIDRDGTVSAMDARAILRASVDLGTPFTEAEQLSADINMDGTVTAADARLALRASVDLEILPAVVCRNEYDALRAGNYAAELEISDGTAMRIYHTEDHGVKMEMQADDMGLRMSLLRTADGTLYMVDDTDRFYAVFDDDLKAMMGEDLDMLDEFFDNVDLFSSYGDFSRAAPDGEANVNGRACRVYKITEIGGVVRIYLDGKKLVRISSVADDGETADIDFKSFSAAVTAEDLKIPADYECLNDA